ncbi:MAG: pentapeptide repeat-containing protein [Acidobacteria bacterium]|jgi:uncharacterized protein YjbI with pentapeptide repeats|nr:pentapeptide repeat-containing protein [Acidobacteriota bacterium]
MTQEELDNLLNEHQKWLEDRSKGKKLELRNLNLKSFHLADRKLYLIVLENIDLSQSNCSKTSFSSGHLRNIKFCGANLDNSDFSDVDMEDIDFSNSKMKEIQIHSLNNAERLTFDNAEMEKAFFVKSTVRNSSFKNALLKEANFKRAFIRNCSFENANVSGADFSYTYLVDVDVKGTKIDDAHFSDARELPEEWKQTIGWYSEEQQNIRRIKEMLREEGLR